MASDCEALCTVGTQGKHALSVSAGKQPERGGRMPSQPPNSTPTPQFTVA